jgi:transcriptional regulator with XRE-family HTH domain
MSETEMAARAGVSRMTIWRLERGDVTVSLAIVLRVLEILNFEKDVDLLAHDDPLGAKLQDIHQPGPRRGSRRSDADEL